MYTMNMQNRHDANVHTLNPIDNGICQAKLTEDPSNTSWHLLLAKIFNSSMSVRTYHGQRVATSVLWDTNQFEPQIGPRGRYATLYKTVYPIMARSWLSTSANLFTIVVYPCFWDQNTTWCLGSGTQMTSHMSRRPLQASKSNASSTNSFGKPPKSRPARHANLS